VEFLLVQVGVRVAAIRALASLAVGDNFHDVASTKVWRAAGWGWKLEQDLTGEVVETAGGEDEFLRVLTEVHPSNNCVMTSTALPCCLVNIQGKSCNNGKVISTGDLL